MFCAIATTIERCKTEAVVDVFQVVKALQLQKPGAVANVVSIIVPLQAKIMTNYVLFQVQYETIFDAVCAFLDNY